MCAREVGSLEDQVVSDYRGELLPAAPPNVGDLSERAVRRVDFQPPPPPAETDLEGDDTQVDGCLPVLDYLTSKRLEILSVLLLVALGPSSPLVPHL